MKTYNIAVLPGDGIGPEIMGEAVRVLEAIAKKYRTNFKYTYADVGGIAYDKHKDPLPKKTIALCENSDAILFGAVGGPKWDKLPQKKRPEKAILGLRKHFVLFANLRPCVIYAPLAKASPLKDAIVAKGVDILIVRELAGDIYFGKKKLEEDYAYDRMEYSKPEVMRIAKVAFEAAMKRKMKVTCVDKSNVLSSSIIFRKFVTEVSKKYPKVSLDCMYVDNAAMQLIKNPSQFDVIVTSNMFGDILSDEAAMITGSIGLLGSASLDGKGFGLYEPAGGTAPDIAGKGIANPIAQILSAAMMLKYSFGMENAAKDIERAVMKALESGYRTQDIMQEGMKLVNTKKMGTLIASNI